MSIGFVVEDEKFLKISYGFLRLPCLSSTDKLLYGHMLNRFLMNCRRDLPLYDSQESIQKSLGISRSAVQRSTKKLISLDFLSVCAKRLGTKTRNYYTVHDYRKTATWLTYKL